MEKFHPMRRKKNENEIPYWLKILTIIISIIAMIFCIIGCIILIISLSPVVIMLIGCYLRNSSCP